MLLALADTPTVRRHPRAFCRTIVGLSLWLSLLQPPPRTMAADSPVSDRPAETADADWSDANQLILAALSAERPVHRRRALEQLEERTTPIPDAIVRRVEEMAVSDPDPLVQGRAQLLSLTWNWHDGTPPAATRKTHAKRDLTPLAAPDLATSSAPLERDGLPRALPASGSRNTDRRPAAPALPLPPWEVTLQEIAVPAIASSDEWSGEFDVEAEYQGLFVESDDLPGKVTLASLQDSEGLNEFDVPPGPLADSLNAVEGEPDVLYRPLEQPFAEPTESELTPDFDTMVQTLRDAPTGYSGRSSVSPTEGQQSGHFVPIEDRWRVGLPYWDRYDKGHPPVDDYPYVEGHKFDPFNQNRLKGDYPIIGQHTFLNMTAATNMLLELRNVPTATTPFESTVDPYQREFFGNPQQFFYTQNFRLAFDLFHGNAAFKPVDWRIKIAPVFNLNYLDVNELGVVGPDVRFGTTRARQDYALEEWFVEKKLADLSPDYDFMSLRVGSQFFNSDFRGFIFTDINRGARLFGTRNANRDQFNLAVFDMLEKETNSLLNSPHDREQTVAIANYYRQDFMFPGYTAQASFHYNNDGPSFEFDHNDFLARPDPIGSFKEHRVEAYYMGFAGDGHIGRINVSNAFYWALGRDSFNPIAGREQDINAQMAALELSYDRDYLRFRTSFFWSSGDDDVDDREARGFDTIMDNPAFAGGGFSYWQRQNIRLFGVGLTQRESLVPDLRSSKFQGQANFVNPGLFLYNLGLDADITPKLRMINNVNFLWFHKTQSLEVVTFQSDVQHQIGVDLSSGFEYRPFLNDNVIFVAGAALFLPGAGYDDLFGKTDPFTTSNAFNFDDSPAFQAFTDLALTF